MKIYLKAKRLKWETWKICKLTVVSLVEEMLESAEAELIPACITRSGWKSSQGGSTGGVTDTVDDESKHNEACSEREGGVNTLTGSVEVAAPQSNIVIPSDGPWRTESQASLEEENTSSQDVAKQIIAENTTVSDRVNVEAEHTPCVGTRTIMSVMHTPLLRPSCLTPLIDSVQAGQESGVEKSRAGFKHQEQEILHRTDMRKLHNIQKSPNLSLPP